MNIYECIFPVQNENYVEGCGFLIGEYFITSGHIIEKSENPFITIEGNKKQLSDPLFFEANQNDPTSYDLAIYSIPTLKNNSLELFEGDIEEGRELNSYSYKRNKSGYDLIECKAIVGSYKEGNYFSALTSMNLKSGCSGSPVLIGNKVVGIMTKGNNDDYDKPINSDIPINLCIFLQFGHIIKLLKVLKKIGYTNKSIEYSFSDLSNKYYNNFKEREKELPYWINLVEVMNLGYRGSGKNENGHSRFLYELFRYTYNETHPIFNSFINRFTDRKGFKSKLGENKITVNNTFSETGRHPDIYINQLGIYDSDETISVVFENKIDYAEDRNKQMQDYIIGMHNERNNGNIILDSNCYAFYLISDFASKRNDTAHDASGRQNVDKENVLNKLIPDKNYILLSYKEDILPWLKGESFPQKECYLTNNINLYIQYLNNRFKYLTDINDIILRSIKRINKMESLSLNELYSLQNGLEKLIYDKKKIIIERLYDICSSVYPHNDERYGYVSTTELNKGHKFKLKENFSIWIEINLDNDNQDFTIGLSTDNNTKPDNQTITEFDINPNKKWDHLQKKDPPSIGYCAAWTVDYPLGKFDWDSFFEYIDQHLSDTIEEFKKTYPTKLIDKSSQK